MPETTTELSLQLSERHTADFEMIANGAFQPLGGFLGSEDWRRVTDEMRLASGEYWSIPITLATDLDCAVGDVVELQADNGKQLGRLTVEEIFDRDTKREAEQVYRTTDSDHPGVAAIYEEGERCIAGPIEVDELPDHEEAFQRRYLTPAESRKAFEDRGWKRIVAFQTRNPIHRAHEYLTKAALETCDGLFIHPLIGKTKAGDIPADVRMALLRGADGEVLPAGPGDPRRQPVEDALRGPAGGDPARAHPPQLRLHPLHRRPRPRRRRRLLRHLRRAEDLRRDRHRRAGDPAALLRAHLLVQRVRGDGVGQDLPARLRRTRFPLRAPRSARCSATARSRRTSSRATRSPRS